MSEFLALVVGAVGGVLAVYICVRVASAAYFKSLRQHNEETK